jgi:hypothetical protein
MHIYSRPLELPIFFIRISCEGKVSWILAKDTNPHPPNELKIYYAPSLLTTQREWLT